MEPAPTPETKTPDLCSIYAATKKHQEDLFLAFGRAYRITTFALRFFNVFGQRQSLANPYTGVAAIFLSRLLSGKPPFIFEDGRQSRDFVDVRDVAQALLLAVEGEAEGVHALNVGTGERVTIADVAAVLARELGLNIDPQRLGRVRVGDIRHCYADPARAERILGFKARYRFATGVGNLIEWCRGERSIDRVEESLQELSREDLVR
jgi:dTDP-L-rhamnose 4-epimerase